MRSSSPSGATRCSGSGASSSPARPSSCCRGPRAQTPASRTRRRTGGLLEVADRGTLFLDEIGDMDAPIQAKLLKVIEEKRFRRVGETRERHTDVRVIAATHHNLLQRVREGLFREDLYYRIGVLP